MLFANPIAATLPLDYHRLKQAADNGVSLIEIQLPAEPYSAAELKEIIQMARVTPIAFRVPEKMVLGTSSFQLDEWSRLQESLADVFTTDTRFVILHGATVPLGVIFEYLDARPTDFNALKDFKTEYVERIIDQLNQLAPLAQKWGIQLLIENAPMGSESYFEPGRAMIYPALRTPRHLLQIAEATDAKLLFDTAHARITSNVLTYMHRSRSMFAGATETEIRSAASSWVDFYQQVKESVGLVRLSYAISWGDTPETSHIPFPETAFTELISFAETVDENVPVTLGTLHRREHLSNMLETLHGLKKG
jgi:sugar phosphate isomerase/epimerase